MRCPEILRILSTYRDSFLKPNNLKTVFFSHVCCPLSCFLHRHIITPYRTSKHSLKKPSHNAPSFRSSRIFMWVAQEAHSSKKKLCAKWLLWGEHDQAMSSFGGDLLEELAESVLPFGWYLCKKICLKPKWMAERKLLSFKLCVELMGVLIVFWWVVCNVIDTIC